MMNQYEMNGWGWFGMATIVIAAVAIVGGVVWAITARR
jgi:hypothetical protein